MTRLLAEIHQYAIIVNAKKEVLWVRSAGGSKRFMFPGGTVERNETPEEALKREVKEETNLEIEIKQPIATFLLQNKKPIQFAIYYLANNPKGKIKLSREHTHYKWAKPNAMQENEVAHPALIELAKNGIKKSKRFC